MVMFYLYTTSLGMSQMVGHVEARNPKEARAKFLPNIKCSRVTPRMYECFANQRGHDRILIGYTLVHAKSKAKASVMASRRLRAET